MARTVRETPASRQPKIAAGSAALEFVDDLVLVHFLARRLLLHPGQRASVRAVPLAHSQKLPAALKARGRSVQLHVVKDADHGFRGASTAEMAAAVKATFDFIDAQTK